jgi:hypothetical protein
MASSRIDNIFFIPAGISSCCALHTMLYENSVVDLELLFVLVVVLNVPVVREVLYHHHQSNVCLVPASTVFVSLLSMFTLEIFALYSMSTSEIWSHMTEHTVIGTVYGTA